MVGQGCPRLLQLPRSADQRSCTGRVPTSCHRSLAAHVTTSQSEASDDLDADDAARGYLASKTDYPPSLAERPLCRYTPEVGAVCGKAARTVLCGGRAVNARPYRYLRWSAPLSDERTGAYARPLARAAAHHWSWLAVSANVSDATIRSRPVFLASYIAMSARRSIRSTVSPRSHSAMPKLQAIANAWS